MQKRQIRITHSCGYTKGAYAGDPEYEAWMEGVRKAFAAVGWIVTGQGPTQSSTHVEEDYLCLECAHGKLDQATLDRVLAQVGILSAEYDGDIEGLERPATITIDAEWWDKCTDLRTLARVLSSAHMSAKIS